MRGRRQIAKTPLGWRASDKGLRQRDVADQAGLSVALIKKLATGRVKPSLKAAVKLGPVLDASPSQLILEANVWHSTEKPPEFCVKVADEMIGQMRERGLTEDAVELFAGAMGGLSDFVTRGGEEATFGTAIQILQTVESLLPDSLESVPPSRTIVLDEKARRTGPDQAN